METVNLSIKTEEQASRMEWLVRIVYWIPLAIVAYIFGLVTGILWVVNILTVLILGKRVAANIIAKYIDYIVKFSAYMLFVTDERPPIMPQL